MSRSVITPHASHSWGTIEGERCCVVCHAAPWMPISEAACEVSCITPTERRDLERGFSIKADSGRRQITRDEWARVEELRTASVPWADVAKALDRNEASLRRGYQRWMTGTGRVGRMKGATQQERGMERAAE